MESCRRSNIGPVAMHVELYLLLLILHSVSIHASKLQINRWGPQQARPNIAEQRCLSCLYQPAVALSYAQLGSSAGIDTAVTQSASLTRRGRAGSVHRGVLIRPRRQLVFQPAQEELAAPC